MLVRPLASGWSYGIFVVVLGLGIAGGLATLFKAAEPAQPKEVVPFWPRGAPGAKGNDPKLDIPTLSVWLPNPEAATGAAVVVDPCGSS